MHYCDFLDDHANNSMMLVDRRYLTCLLYNYDVLIPFQVITESEIRVSELKCCRISRL